MANRVKEYREELGMSQASLAKLAGVSRVTISQIETGTRQVIRSKTMTSISNALKASVPNIFFAE